MLSSLLAAVAAAACGVTTLAAPPQTLSPQSPSSGSLPASSTPTLATTALHPTIPLPILGPNSSGRPAGDLGVLRSTDADATTRAAAARRLITSTDPEVQRAVLEILDPAAQDASLAEVRVMLLREIRATSSAPAWLLPPLSALASASPAADQPGILDAMGSIRTRDSVRALLAFAAPSSPAPIRDNAFAALARLSGRADFGKDLDAWRTWFADIEWRAEAEWLRILNEGLAQGLDRAARDRDRWIARTVEAMRKAYVEETEPAERSKILASLLRDEFATLRRLGVELLNRELAHARVPDESVSLAVLNLLRDPQPDLRNSGAELTSALSTPAAPAALTSALLTETDPVVAASLLRSVTLWPSATVRPVVMRWLATPGPAQRPAIDAAAALLERGVVTPAEVRDPLLTSLRQLELANLPGSGLRLLASLGDDNDRAAVASQLNSDVPVRRTQAADALAAYPTYLPRLLDAAANNAALYITVCRAIAAHEATVNGYLAALKLPAATDSARREGLLLIIERMDRRDLLTAARRTEDPALRELILSRLTAVPLRAPVGLDGPIGPEPTVIGGLFLLAETRLELRQPAGALAAIEALAPVAGAVDPLLCDSIKTVALLWLNRIDEAMTLSAPVSAWLDGLERAVDLAHGADVLSALDRRFGTPASPADRARLRALRDRIVTPMGPPFPLVPPTTPATASAPPSATPSSAPSTTDATPPRR